MRRSLWVGYLVAWLIFTFTYVAGAVSAIRAHELSWVVSGAADSTLAIVGLLAMAYILFLGRWRVWRGYAFRDNSGLFVPAYLECFALASGLRLPEAVRSLRRDGTS